MGIKSLPLAKKFITELDDNSKKKLWEILSYFSNTGGLIQEPFFKKVKNDLYEIRILSKPQIRIFFTTREGELILLSGFYKKSNKIPKREISKADNLIKRL